jgi:hypothetical protein
MFKFVLSLFEWFILAWPVIVILNLTDHRSSELWFAFAPIYFRSSLISLLCVLVALIKEPRSRLTRVALVLHQTISGKRRRHTPSKNRAGYSP